MSTRAFPVIAVLAMTMQDCRHTYDEGGLALLEDTDFVEGFGAASICDSQFPLLSERRNIEVDVRQLASDELRQGRERLEYVHPECGFQVLPRAVADAKLRTRESGHDLFPGQRKGT